MTDRTHPDSGRATGAAHIIRYALEMGLLWIDGDGRDKVREALDALDTLENQIEAIGAGGVNGPLMGQPQAMPDLSVLTERGAQAWAGVDAQGLRDGAASAGSEPVAEVMFADGKKYIQYTMPKELLPVGTKLYLHPSPPEGMAGGWMPMADAPRDGTLILAAIYIHSSDGTAEWQRHAIYFDEERDCTYLDGGDDTGWEFDDYEFWTPLPPPPTTPAGNEKGE